MTLSIDQSLSCSGITIWDNKGNCKYLDCIKTMPKDEVILRIRDIVLQLGTLCIAFNIETIVVESLPFGLNSTSVRPLAGLHMCIQNFCKDTAITFTESHVTQVKKLATGKGNAKKQDMIDALPADFKQRALDAGYKKTTGLADLADSYWIYKLYRSKNDAVK